MDADHALKPPSSKSQKSKKSIFKKVELPDIEVKEEEAFNLAPPSTN
jgi:hypothetical protein